MPIIKLPPEVVRRIAAGEVIDHPHSVIKELVENALDAEASFIRVKIYAGGKSKIIVEDNGKGMAPEELKIAILPHTTSKIEKFEDIFQINSYGFRGEALASIGAVSKMKIETSQNGEMGASIEVRGGNIGEVEPIAKNKGTTVTVSELFFNVPPRRKFLSSASVETRMVTEMIQKFILSHDVGFYYSHDDQEIFNVKRGTSLEQRIKLVFSDIELLEVNSSFGGIRIHGYVSPPYVGRKNRTTEVIFVNDRYVRSGLLMKAIEVGYAEHLKKGEFPTAVLFVDLPPQLVDVNVHPQKLEVRFSDNSKIFSMVVAAVKKALASPNVFQIPPEQENEKDMRVEESSFIEKKEKNSHRSIHKPDSHLQSLETRNFSSANSIPFQTSEFNRRKEFQLESNEELRRERLSQSKILGVLHGRYIACESEKALYLIDMHAAHERILYDEFRKNAVVTTQKLTIPIKLNLNPVQEELLKEKEEEVRSFGFEWKNDELIGVPQIRKALNWKELFLEVLESFRLSFAQDPREEFFANLACKAAIKSNERISKEEIKEILTRLDDLEVWSCPHGRPLVYSIDFKRLDRYFGR